MHAVNIEELASNLEVEMNTLVLSDDPHQNEGISVDLSSVDGIVGERQDVEQGINVSLDEIPNKNNYRHYSKFYYSVTIKNCVIYEKLPYNNTFLLFNNTPNDKLHCVC